MASLAFSLVFYGKIHIENLRQKYLGKGCLLLFSCFFSCFLW